MKFKDTMNDDNLLTRLIAQLDTLIPFLAISHQDVFELMQQERYIWFPENQQGAFPDSYEVYQIQITHSAFLLGYSYSEAFLADLAREIYQQNPRMLPSDKQLKFGDILGTTTYEEVINVMIEKEILALFYQSMEKIIKHFQGKLRLDWDERYCQEAIVASLTRNCIIHNRSYRQIGEIGNHQSS